MKRPPRLRISSFQARMLSDHLFPGDGKEAIAFALCGRHRGNDGEILMIHQIHPIPYTQCSLRSSSRVTWNTEGLEPLLQSAAASGFGVVKFHSHPDGLAEFSAIDDDSDQDLFKSIHGWIDDDGPHGSVIVLPNGDMSGRVVDAEGHYSELNHIMVVGDDIAFHMTNLNRSFREYALRHAQLFGDRTTNLLGSLRIGVVGCSGTGGFVVEMLARLGVRELVLVDPDRVEYRNLNRIIGTTAIDAALRKFKVEALAENVARIGVGTQVRTVPKALASIEAVNALANCDVVFGCMDSHDGRRTLNRLSNYYLLPYFDCGVGLQADGVGGIDEICAACHYVQPGRSTLLDRGVIRQERADAEAIARGNPAEYQRLHAQKYLEGVEVENPSVVTVNALAASLVMNEFLARIHPFRSEANERMASIRFNLGEMYLDLESEVSAGSLPRSLGKGDVEPLLDMSELSTGV
ncbi:MAG: ThiF family adenylyltransferase [Patescibacteria group bacterium]|nr:ThiF family adenylyltransferase [Patescibacteria group bacterium]